MRGLRDDAVVVFCEEFWNWRMEDNPEFATFCGIHDYDDRMNDISEAAYEERKRVIQKFLDKSETINCKDVSSNAQIDMLLLKEELRSTLAGMNYKGYYFPLNFLEGVHVDINQQIGWMKFETEEDFQKYVRRLKSYAKQINQANEVLSTAITKKMTYPAESVASVANQIELMIAGSGNHFLKPFLENSSNLSSTFLHMKEQVKTILEDDVIPSLICLKEYFTGIYMKHLRTQIGVCSLPNGEAYYQQCINFHVSSAMNPQEIHELGLTEVARIKSLMMKVFEEEGLPLNIRESVNKLKSDRVQFCKTSDDLLNTIKHICYEKIRPELPRYFKNLPKTNMSIVAASSLMSECPPAYYLAGTRDGSRPGCYYVNLTKVDVCPKYELMALSLHEGEPGHHTQAMSAISQENTPCFRQYLEDLKYYLSPSRFPLHTAYVEGWGLYCEALGEELGLYEDNFSLFGRYSFEIHRACRLVVDTGIHAFGWSRQEAATYLAENCPLDAWFIGNEINRYITWPGQALGYKIGELKIWDLRKKAESELGDRFKMHDFHDAVLHCGPVSLSILEMVISNFIKDTKQETL